MLALHLRELVFAMLFRSSAYQQPASSSSESDQDVSLKTPTKDRTRQEAQQSSSKAPRPGAPVSPGGSDFKSPGVQAKELNKPGGRSPGVQSKESPGVQSKESPKPGSSEFKSPGVGDMKKKRAPPGVMGTCRGQRPPKSKAKRQAFEEKRLERQQQQQQQQRQAVKRRQASAKAKITKARSRYAQHISWAIKQFRADHPHASPAAAMAYAGQSYSNELQRQGLESKRAKGEKARIARRAAKQAKEALQQAEAEQREQRAAEVKKDRMEKMAEGLRLKQEAAKAEATTRK